MLSGTWDKFKAWLARPFSDDMDAMGWFMFFGLVIVISALWAIILRHIREAIT